DQLRIQGQDHHLRPRLRSLPDVQPDRAAVRGRDLLLDEHSIPPAELRPTWQAPSAARSRSPSRLAPGLPKPRDRAAAAAMSPLAAQLHAVRHKAAIEQEALPVLWHLKVSNYNEKARWALDYK